MTQSAKFIIHGRQSRYIIYGLIDPVTRLIFYVGLSRCGVQRPKQHQDAPTKGSQEWVEGLKRDGLLYEIVILKNLRDRSELPKEEIWWIAFGKCLGWPLGNRTRGGEYNSDSTAELSKFEKWKKKKRLEEDLRDKEAHRLLMCITIYKDEGARAAIEAAKGYCSLVDCHLEWLETALIKHYLTICEDLPPRLECPCGHSEEFYDSTSLLKAIENMNHHFRDISQRLTFVSEPDTGTLNKRLFKVNPRRQISAKESCFKCKCGHKEAFDVFDYTSIEASYDRFNNHLAEHIIVSTPHTSNTARRLKEIAR